LYIDAAFLRDIANIADPAQVAIRIEARCLANFDHAAEAHLFHSISPDSGAPDPSYEDVLDLMATALCDHVAAWVSEAGRADLRERLFPHLELELASRTSFWLAEAARCCLERQSAAGEPPKATVSGAQKTEESNPCPPQTAVMRTLDGGVATRTGMTVAQVAERLSVSEDTIRRMYRRNELKIIHIGRQVRIPVSEFRRLHASRQPAS